VFLPKDNQFDFCFSLVLFLIMSGIFLSLDLDGFDLWICALNKVGSNLGTALPYSPIFLLFNVRNFYVKRCQCNKVIFWDKLVYFIKMRSFISILLKRTLVQFSRFLATAQNTPAH
jgi:hypothetical protein